MPSTPKTPTDERVKKLPLLEGLRWEGHLYFQKHAEGYWVRFDAFEPATDMIVYDQTILTAKQMQDWTGYDK